MWCFTILQINFNCYPFMKLNSQKKERVKNNLRINVRVFLARPSFHGRLVASGSMLHAPCSILGNRQYFTVCVHCDIVVKRFIVRCLGFLTRLKWNNTNPHLKHIQYILCWVNLFIKLRNFWIFILLGKSYGCNFEEVSNIKIRQYETSIHYLEAGQCELLFS